MLVYLPSSMVPEGITEEEFQIEAYRIWRACVSEYYDPEYKTRTHFNVKTYQAGCKGPLCMTAMRRQRRNSQGHKGQERLVQEETLAVFYLTVIEEAEVEMLQSHELMLRQAYKIKLGEKHAV